MASGDDDGGGRGYLWLAISVLAVVIAARVLTRYWSISFLGDLVSQLPLVLRQLDPGYLAGDWYLERMNGLTVRTGFVTVIAWLTRLVGLDLAVFLYHLICLAVAAWAGWRLAVKGLGGGPLAGILAAALTVIGIQVFLDLTEIALISSHAKPRGMAKALTALAVTFAVERRWRPVATCLLAAAVFQIAYPAWTALALLAAWAAMGLTERRDMRTTRTAGPLGALLAAVLVPMAAALFTGAGDPEESRLVYIVADLRNPHHFLLAGWDVRDAVLAVLLVAGATLPVWAPVRGRPDGPATGWVRGMLLAVSAAVVAYAVVGLVLVTALPSRVGLGLQGFRYLHLIAFMALPILAVAAERWAAGHWPGRLPALARRLDRPAVAALAVAVSALVLFAPFRLEPARRAAYALTGFVPTRQAVLETSAAGTASAADEKARRNADIAALITAVDREVPPDGLIFAPPDMDLLRVLPGRAVVVGFKSWLFGDPEAWFARFTEAYGPIAPPGGFDLLARLNDRYARRTCAEIVATARRFGATHSILEHARLGEASRPAEAGARRAGGAGADSAPDTALCRPVLARAGRFTIVAVKDEGER